MKILRAYLEVRESLISFLQEDVGTGDVTSESVLSPDLFACAQIICKYRKIGNNSLVLREPESFSTFVGAGLRP